MDIVPLLSTILVVATLATIVFAVLLMSSASCGSDATHGPPRVLSTENWRVNRNSSASSRGHEDSDAPGKRNPPVARTPLI